eukprot:365323-Chlamydomonas_euryale.AAC.4
MASMLRSLQRRREGRAYTTGRTACASQHAASSRVSGVGFDGLDVGDEARRRLPRRRLVTVWVQSVRTSLNALQLVPVPLSSWLPASASTPGRPGARAWQYGRKDRGTGDATGTVSWSFYFSIWSAIHSAHKN